MKCSKCGFENLDEANFCIKCGARIDGKIPCPKCGEYIPNDAANCPNCGKAIPHKSESIEVMEEKKSVVKTKVSSIFNRVSTFVTLFVIIALVTLTLGRQFNFLLGGKTYLDPYTYLIDQFRFFDGSFINLSLAVVRTFILLLDFLVTIVVGIMSIKKTIKCFKNRNEITEVYKYLGVLIVTKILTFALLQAACGPTDMVYKTSAYESFMFCAIAHLSVCLGFECYLAFRRGQISLFIAKIILAFGIYLPLLIISVLCGGNAYHSVLANNHVGFIAHYIEMIDALGGGYYYDGFISTFVLSTISLFFIVASISIAFYFFVFYATSYFNGLTKFRKFRITFYMSTILISIATSSLLISSVIEHELFSRYLSLNIAYDASPVGAFIFALLLIGVSVTTFNIYSKASRRASLEEKTTKVE